MSPMTQSHVALAIGHLEAVSTYRDHLHELYEQQRGGRYGPDLGARIAECHQSIGHGLKAASIHAAIAQAVALEKANELAKATEPDYGTLTYAEAAKGVRP